MRFSRYILFLVAVAGGLNFSALALAQADPQGVRDSFYVECSTLADTASVQLRFFSDNTDSNRVGAFGMPVLITVSNNALVQLDTTVATTFSGSMVSSFPFLSTETASCCGGNADPTISPVHFILGALTFGNGVTGDGLFANLRLMLNGDTTTITVDTLSTTTLSPTLVTEQARAYTPGWWPGGFSCGVISSVKERNSGEASVLPSSFSLQQNYPNPFNAVTTIQFDLPRAGQVRVEIFNVLGQRVRILVDEELQPGYKQVVWDGTDQSGNPVASGVYFYRLKAGYLFSTMKKMSFLK